MRVERYLVPLQRAALPKLGCLPKDECPSLAVSQAQAGMQRSRMIHKMAHPGILHHDDAGVALLRPHLGSRRAAVERHIALHRLRSGPGQ